MSLKKVLETKHSVYMAGGQGDLSGRIIRIGHLGFVTNESLLFGLKSLGKELIEMGYSLTAEDLDTAILGAKSSLDG